jgi:energy-coupling factor transporter ATP-binding protein EcfA2
VRKLLALDALLQTRPVLGNSQKVPTRATRGGAALRLQLKGRTMTVNLSPTVNTRRTLRIEGAGMVFPTRRGPFVALRDIHLDVQRGEFVTLIGHSGCGKSTLLNLVAGLTTPTSGVLLLEERNVGAEVMQSEVESLYAAAEREGRGQPAEEERERTRTSDRLAEMEAIEKREEEVAEQARQDKIRRREEAARAKKEKAAEEKRLKEEEDRRIAAAIAKARDEWEKEREAEREALNLRLQQIEEERYRAEKENELLLQELQRRERKEEEIMLLRIEDEKKKSVFFFYLFFFHCILKIKLYSHIVIFKISFRLRFIFLYIFLNSNDIRLNFQAASIICFTKLTQKLIK